MHNGSFGWVNFQLCLISQAIAEGRFAGDKFALFHPSLIAYLLILGDGYGFLLCQSAKNAYHHFGGKRFGIDILFFKQDGHAIGCELTQRGETVLGVSGKAGNRLYQNAVNLSCFTIGHHALKLVPG